jgi:DNA polymerase I
MGKTFYIIDGHAEIFRAYFAPFRNLSSPTGEPTKATFVFTQMLLNLVQNHKPDYLAMVIDAGDETVFRREIDPNYKANREPPPEDFHPQEQRILQIVRAAGVPLYVKPGAEADDLIATMVRRLCDKGFETTIVSRDKDLRQIVNDCTRMYDILKDEMIDAAYIEKKHGYRPDQAVEVQTLVGDPTDNILGIPGIGEKTAAKLIGKYGSVEGIYAHLDELTPKLRENLQKYAPRLEISRKLVKLKDDVDFDFDAERCRFVGLSREGLKQHLQELGFHALLKRLGEAPEVAEGQKVVTEATTSRVARGKKPEEGLFGPMGPVSEAKPELGPVQTGEGCDYCLVATEEAFEEFLSKLMTQKRFAFDTETDALGAMCSNLIGLSFSWKEGGGYYVAVCGPAGSTFLDCDRVLSALKPILEDESVRKVGHNIKYDMLVMRQAGIALRGIEMDSMIGAFLLDASRMQYGIDRLALELLNFQKVPTAELIGKGKKQISLGRVDLEKVARYAAEDADIALRLADLVEQRLRELPAVRKLADDLETPLVEALAEMEYNGVSIDPAILKEQSQVLGERAEELHRRILEEAGCEFNPDSPKQLADVLFNRLGLRIIKRTKTGPSTDIEVLEKLANMHPVPKLILEYRSLVKLKNTYLDNLTQYVNERTGRIHASFNQTGAATGRLSCSDPNLQNIPIRTDEGRRIRLAFVPADPERNVLLTADYSQIELRVLAHFTKEPALMRAFEADEDIHRAVAAEVFGVPLEEVTRGQRDQAKTINFGIIYGVSAYGLSRRIEGLSVPAAKELIDAYNRRFPSIAGFVGKCVQEAQSQGYVETILGRRRPLPDIASGVIAIRNASERMAINSVIQGSAADLIKVAMLNIHRRIKGENRPSRMLMQVHDELVFEIPADHVEAEAAMIRHEMTTAMKLAVPLKVELGWGKNWQEVK